LGGAFFVEPLFNGVTLLIAIGIAGYGSRRRSRAPKRTATSAAATPASTLKQH